MSLLLVFILCILLCDWNKRFSIVCKTDLEQKVNTLKRDRNIACKIWTGTSPFIIYMIGLFRCWCCVVYKMIWSSGEHGRNIKMFWFFFREFFFVLRLFLLLCWIWQCTCSSIVLRVFFRDDRFERILHTCCAECFRHRHIELHVFWETHFFCLFFLVVSLFEIVTESL